VEFTYETGIDEPIHPDFMVASRFIEIGMGNMCEFGCKIYADPRSNVKVLAHSEVYGCNTTGTIIAMENDLYAAMARSDAYADSLV
jgi:hypothetical protein